MKSAWIVMTFVGLAALAGCSSAAPGQTGTDEAAIGICKAEQMKICDCGCGGRTVEICRTCENAAEVCYANKVCGQSDDFQIEGPLSE